MTNYLPFDLEKALAGEPYGVWDKREDKVYPAKLKPHVIPDEYNSIAPVLVPIDCKIVQFEKDGEPDSSRFSLVMLPKEPVVTYGYSNEYERQVGVAFDEMKIANAHACDDRLGLLKHTFHDGRWVKTERVEDYTTGKL